MTQHARVSGLSDLAGKTILVTGATGMIGSTIVRTILGDDSDSRVLALVRNEAKARAMFADLSGERLTFVVSDITDPLSISEPVDYIVHGASQTASKAFVCDPVGIIKTAVDGTRNVLEMAREKRVKALVYLSTMEVYGTPQTDDKITEAHGTSLDTMTVRSSYAESKRMCEVLCAAYHAQYGVPARVLRLCQTFGPGVNYDDNRVFAEFVRCAVEGRDIVLHTTGETRRNYLYTEDAVGAILTVLLHGQDGEAYNAANEAIYCSIREMAEMVAEICTNGRIKVRIETEDEGVHGYAPVLRMNLDTGKLRQLGWLPTTDLSEMLRSLFVDMRERKGKK